MRVAFVNQDRGIGPERRKGAAVHVRSMRTAFGALGAEVLPIDESDGARVRQRLERSWEQGGLDLIYERYALGCADGAEFACARDVPHVLEVNAPLAEEQELWRGSSSARDVLAREEYAFRNATRIIAVSTDVARYVRERGGAAETLDVLPNGVDIERFRPRPDDLLRDRLAPAGRLVVGFHGRLRPWHGFGMLATACARLLERGVPLHLVLVGEGDFDPDLDGLVPAERVTRVGWVDHDQVGHYVAAMDVLPLTYDPDQPCYFSPLKLAEAMACGVVPVVPDIGDLARLVSDGESGLVYRAGSLEELVEGIERLHAEPARTARLSAAAVRAAEERSWSRIAAHVLEHSRARRVR